MNKDIYRIALTFLPDIGDVRAKLLIAYCGSPEAVFEEKPRVLEKIPGVGKVVSKIKNKAEAIRKAEKELKFIYDNEVRMHFFTDEDYPRRLFHCDDGPVLLYSKGNSNYNKEKIVSIVGTRNATEYGKQVTEQLVAELKMYEVTIVSGLAYGIDVIAHKACLEEKVETTAVLGHGLDRIYPDLHTLVAKRMIENGSLLTDFPSGTQPDRENFPKRNRVVAGMCDALIVVEAAKKGGALITANIANSYNRDVFAVPGKINDTYSEGCNLLIRSNKAHLIQSADDMAYIMGWEMASKKIKKRAVQINLFNEMNEEEKTIYSVIKEHNKLHIDELSYRCGMSVSKTSALLLNMEFSGMIRSLPGKIYELI